MDTHQDSTTETVETAARPGLIAMIDRRAAEMSKTRARERIATLVVASILQIAVALLVLSHAPDAPHALPGVAFAISLMLALNGALAMICRRRIVAVRTPAAA